MAGFRRAQTQGQEHNVAVRPNTGFPLKPDTNYAVVFTTDIKSSTGDPLTADDDLTTLLGTTAPTAGTQLSRKRRGTTTPRYARALCRAVLRSATLAR